MEQHLPQIYLAFRDAHPEVAKALDELGRSTNTQALSTTAHSVSSRWRWHWAHSLRER